MEIVSSGQKPSFDVEIKRLQDDNGPFLRHYQYNGATGALLSTFDTDLAGVTYVPVGTIEEPSIEITQPCYVYNGRQALPVTDALALNLTVPADTVYAEIQVIGGNIAFTIDGATAPLNTGANGNLVFDCGYFKLGCGDGDNLGDPAEVADFEVIALAGTTPRLEINYFKKA